MLTNSKSRNSLFTLLAAVAIGVFVWINIPPSYNINVTEIGKGRFALVQVFDDGMKYSYVLKELVNNVRDEFENEIDFYIVEDTNLVGQSFIKKYRVPSFTLMLFSPDGKVLHKSKGVDNEAVLKNILNKALKRNSG